MDINMLKLAMQAEIPLISVRTDDAVYVEEVLTHLNGSPVKQVNLPDVIVKSADFAKTLPAESVLYTSSETKSLAKLWRIALESEKTIVFVNTQRSPLQFDGGVLIPPKDLVLQFLKDMGDESLIPDPEELLPALGGMTLKDVLEVSRMTMTRDAAITVRGINETRRGYSKLQGITQVDTAQDFYIRPKSLDKWLKENAQFFKDPKHPALMPRGLLFDGPPGTGKTAGSKEIADAFEVPLYRLDLGAMMGKYVGESEGNLNAALAQVDEVAPAVIIFDEVEKVFQGQSDSGVTSRLLSQLLWWLQEHKSKVFTVMTTNNLSAIPAELWRPGRIDAVLNFLGIETKAEGQKFAQDAYLNMLTSMEQIASPADLDYLKKEVSKMFIDGKPVPQAQLTMLAHAVVKKTLAGNID